VGAALIGMDIRLCGPQSCWPDADLVTQCRTIAESTGARITLTEKHAEGLEGADFVYTDVWVSMGEPDAVWEERIALLSPYQVTTKGHGDDRHSLTPSSCTACPPSTTATRRWGRRRSQKFGIDCMEVTDEVFESPASVVFDQAENRMHTIKAVLVATMGAVRCALLWPLAAMRLCTRGEPMTAAAQRTNVRARGTCAC
jgi:ornithine carbamoyltransferase